MRCSVDERAMRDGPDLEDRQGVQFAAEEESRAGSRAVEDRSDAMAAKAPQDAIGGISRQMVRNRVSRPRLIAGDLGMAVQVVPQRDCGTDVPFIEQHALPLSQAWRPANGQFSAR